MKKYIILLTILSLLWIILSCSDTSSDDDNYSFVPNLDLVQYGYEDLPVHAFSGTYVACFEKNNKQMHFIGVIHSSEFDNPAYLTLESEFDTFNPDAAVVERRDSNMGISPQYYINRFSDISNVNGEPDYTIYLSIHNEPFVDFIAAEPPTNVVENRIIDYSINSRQLDAYDYLYFTFMRRINGLKENGTITDQAQLEAEFDSRISILIDDYDISVSPVPDFTDFSNWYEIMLGFTFNFDHDLDIHERDDNIGLLWNYLDYIRDTNIIENIAMMCNTYNRVLVVYGSAHYNRIKIALIDMFGIEPQEYQLYSD